MFITPMQRLDGIGIMPFGSAQEPIKESESNIFKDLLKSAIDADKAAAVGLQDLATGEVDDLHNLTIDETKAQLSIELMVQIRNKLFESYSEIMRINL